MKNIDHRSVKTAAQINVGSSSYFIRRKCDTFG